MYNNVHQGHNFQQQQSNVPCRPPPPPNVAQQQRSQPPPAAKSPINVVGIPSVHISNTNQLVVGSSQSSSTRSYTPLKVLGDGSFGTVWLCDWHGTLPPNTPLSPMQCGAGAKPEWAGKRLVAVKRMKKKWDGGWDECQKLKEIESLRAIPFHPNIIPLYDFFLLPASKELYFVFESMEGNLYHLIKARKGRALAGGLVSSIFLQMVSGLDHIHRSGYFHRDMKPENVLVTTTGLFDYTTLSPIAPHNAPPEKDVVAIIKLADFGLARETKSHPPYTEYVSTRWYRAPEVLLLSTDYSNPVDMWALGTIMAELVNLRPLFPGQDQGDQITKICEVLGDPSDDYRMGGVSVGGGPWIQGIKMAHSLGFSFTKMPPRDLHTYFDKTVPLSLIHCIQDLLRYDPDVRLTAMQCLHHPYLQETLPRNNIPLPPGVRMPTQTNGRTSRSATQHQPHHPTPHRSPHRTPFFPTHKSHSQYQQSAPHVVVGPNVCEDYPMDDASDEYISHDHPMEIPSSPMAQEHPTRPRMDPDPNYVDVTDMSHHMDTKPSKPLPKKKRPKWIGIFDRSHHNGLAPVHEMPPPAPSSGSMPSLKRTQSTSSDSKSTREPSPPPDKKWNRKEAERLQLEAEKQRRALAFHTQREQARAVMQRRRQIMVKKDDPEWSGSRVEQQVQITDTVKEGSTGPIRHPSSSAHLPNGGSTLNAASGRFASPDPSPYGQWRDNERLPKARRIDYDDNHSMSSSDVHSIGRMSTISFATIDSDPGPSRIRNRPSLFGLNRMQSTSSLRTSFDAPSASAHSSNSYALEGQLANDFRTHASVDPTSLHGSLSPPPMQLLSLSPSQSPPLSPAPTWVQGIHPDSISSRRGQAPPYLPSQPSPRHPFTGFEFNGHAHTPSPYGHPPSPAPTHDSDINPIFKVPPLPSMYDVEEPLVLPPFSDLDAVAGGGYDHPPLSPMSFTTPDDG